MTVRKVNYAFAVLLSACLLHTAFCLPNSRESSKVKRQTPSSDGTIFFEGVGDLVTGLINTGLRSVAALITSGSEATQRMAVAVGTAALPPLLNVTRSFTRVQQSSRTVFENLTNGSQPILREPGIVRNVTRRVAQGIRPGVVTLEEAFNKTLSNGPLLSGLFGGNRGNTTRVNPNDSEIPDYIDEPTL